MAQVRVGRRVLVYRVVKDGIEIKPVGRHWKNAYKVAFVDIFRLGARQRTAEIARQKRRLKTLGKKLRKAAKHTEDGDGLPTTLLSEADVFLLSHGPGRHP